MEMGGSSVGRSLDLSDSDLGVVKEDGGEDSPNSWQKEQIERKIRLVGYLQT